MASGGDRIQIALEAKDEISQKITKVKGNLKELEAQQSRLEREFTDGNTDIAASYEAVRDQVRAAKADLVRLGAERSEQQRIARNAANEERKAQQAAEAATKRNADAVANLTRRIDGLTNSVVRQRSGWDRLSARVSAFSSRASSALDKVRNKVDNLNTRMSGLSGLGRTGALAVGAAGAGTAFLGLTTASQLEQSQIALEQMTGSAAEAQKMIEWLKATSAQTPFELTGLTQATQKLLAFGFTAEEARDNLMVIGDAASATGLGQDGIDRVTIALGQMQAKQKISGEEMLQLTEAGIPAWQLLADKMGLSVAELQDMTAAQGGAAKVFAAGGLPKLIDAMGEKYDGLMGKQSQTLGGLMSTLRDTVSLAAADLVQRHLPAIKQALRDMIAGVGSAFATASRVMATVGPIIERVVNFLKANPEVFKAAAVGVGVLTVAMWALAAATWATGIPPLVLAVTALIGVMAYLYFKFENVRKVINFVGKALYTLWSVQIKAVIGGWKLLFSWLKSVVGVVGSIKDAFVGLWRGMAEGVQSAVTTVLDWLSQIPGLGFLIDRLPGRWMGGPVEAGQPYMVGEIGPELFVPNVGSPTLIGAGGPEVRSFGQSGVVIPNHLLGAATAAAPQVTVNAPATGGAGVKIDTLVVNDAYDADAQLTALMRREERIRRERMASHA